MADACDSEMFRRGSWVQASYPPGGTPRLYGRQDARRYSKATGPHSTGIHLRVFQFELERVEREIDVTDERDQ